MPASVVHSATVAHGGNPSRPNGRQRNRVYRLRLGVGRIWHEGHGQPSHRRHLQQCSLHHVCAFIGLAARIGPACHPLATERLAIDGGVEATQRDGGGSAFRPAPTCSQLHRRLDLLEAHWRHSKAKGELTAANIAKLPELVRKERGVAGSTIT